MLKEAKNLAPAGMLLLVVAFLIFGSTVSRASDIYIAQNASGAINGADCADAYAVTWFNSSANWGSTTGKIGPGTTVHLCGIFNAPAGASGYLTFQGSGISGSPITLLFETGAVLEAPYWSGGAINLRGQNYLTINGGTNGLCEATQNGTSLTYQQDGGGCVVSGSNVSNVIIENLTISNIYVRNCGGVPCSDASGGNTFGIQIWTGTNDLIQSNKINDAHWLITVYYGGSASTSTNLQVTHNTLSDMDHGVIFGDQGNNSVLRSSNCSSSIDNNDFSNMQVWDNTADAFHHDAIHVWANNTPGSNYTGVCLYDNYAHGNMGQYPSGIFTLESIGTNDYVFNNVIDLTAGGLCADGALAKFSGAGADGSGNTWANNTVIPGTQCTQDIGIQENSGGVLENNLFMSNSQTYVYSTSGSITAANYNVYGTAAGSNPFFGSCGSGISFATWQKACGFDVNGKLTSVTLNANYTLPSGSPAIGAGTNLTSLGITALDTAAPLTFGVAGACGAGGCVGRPSTGAWDTGAYEYGTGTGPSAPTGLAAVVH